ncbi:cdc42 effector protein 2 [Brachyhypopomus gauderio]|uniref:cdc42 effector protein 2 n=1 Tax=Brachyhypopomus gauderio TaxID=698409 RepID=UPI0040410EFA
MAAKAPIYLKRRSRKGKKEKLRDLLSSDMISPPLGDFRHTIHIGSGGGDDDLFGDLSFLQGKFHLLPGQQDPQGGSSLSRAASVSGAPPATDSSPLLKNAVSLPVIGAVQALTLPAGPATVATTRVPQLPPSPPSMAPPPKPPRLHLESPPSSLPASPSRTTPPSLGPCLEGGGRGRGAGEDEEEEERPYLSHAGSLLSLHLDLGPSILDDVLQIMDSQRTTTFNGGFTPSGRKEVFI